MCVLWSQFCYPLALNSKTLFEAIIDSNDQVMSASAYNKWLRGLFSDEVRSVYRDIRDLAPAYAAEQYRRHSYSISERKSWNLSKPFCLHSGGGSLGARGGQPVKVFAQCRCRFLQR